jgi:CxxC-x17-CxxC domain-containing protein
LISKRFNVIICGNYNYMKDFNKRGGFGGGAGAGRGGFGGGRPFKSFKVGGDRGDRGGDRGASFGPSRGPAQGGYTKSFNKFGNDRGGDRGGRGGFGGPTEMHQAVCARCGKTCEVPFRPNGRKPVFCKDCFSQQDNGAPAQSYSQPAPRRDYSPAPAAASSTPDYKAQFEQMNAKIDTLTRMVKALGYAQANAAVPAAEQVVVATLKVGEGDEAKAESAPEKPKAKKAKKA